METKRKSPRKALKVYLKVTDEKTDELFGYMVDVTKEGIQLTSEDVLETEVSFQLKLELPVEIEGKKFISFSSTSKWSEKDRESDYYNSGFQLDEISAEDQKLVEQLIQKFCFNDQ